MKTTGIVRKTDPLGRVVIPIEIRRELGIEQDDALEIFIDGDQLILRRYVPFCIFCGEKKGLIYYQGRKICRRCFLKIEDEFHKQLGDDPKWK